MRKTLLILILGIAVFVYFNRERIYVWDPLASVTRNGVKQDHERVMINASNDVLMDDSMQAGRRLYLVQHWDRTAKYATGVSWCIQYLACMLDADHASGVKVVAGPQLQSSLAHEAAMTDRAVDFVDATGEVAHIVLR